MGFESIAKAVGVRGHGFVREVTGGDCFGRWTNSKHVAMGEANSRLREQSEERYKWKKGLGVCRGKVIQCNWSKACQGEQRNWI